MAENYLKSKLKRKKCSEEKLNPEVSSRGPGKRGLLTPLSGDRTADTEGWLPVIRSVVPAAAWWSRQQPPAVESLWAFALKSALPYLENQQWDLVPDLPHPSTARPSALKSGDQQWCDLGEEVAPFPEPSTLWSPDPVRLSSSLQELSAQTTPAAHTSDGPLSSHSRQRHDGKTASLQALAKKHQPSLHSWEETASPAGCSRVKGEEGMKGGEEEEEAGPVHRQHLTNQGKVSDGRDSLQKEGGNKEEVQQSVRGDVRAGGAGAGGGRLQSCPMCLLEFPVGFTQMDCDGHLAQCLSEMNVDMTW
ncbi:uncharacterized protein [Trachinotus anak]|uniref:uncharacterized protein n=1 Tax=Trachinotus anak TaxID=443729 RepID=UPI0039F1AE45